MGGGAMGGRAVGVGNWEEGDEEMLASLPGFLVSSVDEEIAKCEYYIKVWARTRRDHRHFMVRHVHLLLQEGQ